MSAGLEDCSENRQPKNLGRSLEKNRVLVLEKLMHRLDKEIDLLRKRDFGLKVDRLMEVNPFGFDVFTCRGGELLQFICGRHRRLLLKEPRQMTSHASMTPNV